MSDENADGIRSRLTRQSEDALGRLAQELLENPMVSGRSICPRRPISSA
jgi:hypothetical protein